MDDNKTNTAKRESKTGEKSVVKPKPVSKKKEFEVILVANEYLVYKTQNSGNIWISSKKYKDVKVGDFISI